jgi:hypothetical protein
VITFLLALAGWTLAAAIVAPLVGRGIRGSRQAELIAERTERAEARKRDAA